MLFDGVCNLCNASVDFILRHEKTACLRFAALQSESGQSFLQGCGLSAVPETIILLEGGRCYPASTAVLRIAKYLRFPWNLLSVFLLVPPPLRDVVYRQIAGHRYRWFGRRETCRMPSAEEQERFL